MQGQSFNMRRLASPAISRIWRRGDRAHLKTRPRFSMARPARLFLAFVAMAAVPASFVFQVRGSQEDVSQSAYLILERRCFQCHGANGVARKNIFVLDRERLVSSGAVVPGDSGSLLLRVVESGQMPLNGPRLSPEEIALLKAWLQAGAPDWADRKRRTGERQFLTEPAILALIRDDL